MIDAAEHRDRIMSAVAALEHQVAQPPFGVRASWQRCLQTYGLDPTDRRKPPMLSESEVRSRIAVLDRSEEVYRQGLSELSSLLDGFGYEVSLCDPEGVTLLNLPSRLDKGARNIERPGTTWLEAIVGTNGIGTCLWDARPVSVVGDEHFLSCYASNNCGATPVKDADGKIIAVINITAPSGTVSPETHALACEVLNGVADKIGRRLFRIKNESCFLIELLVGRKGPGLIAVREEGTIISADLRAQAFLSLGPGPRVDAEALRGTTIWEYFDRHEGLLAARTSVRSIPLTRTNTGIQVAARSFIPQKRSWANSIKAAGVAPFGDTSSTLCLEAACGGDPAMAKHLRLLDRVKDLSIPILLVGETGVGKNVLAQAIHASSARAANPYVFVSCSGTSEASLSQELFGYSDCSPMDSTTHSYEEGRLLQADGGTVVLNEIGDLPDSVQVKLLRFFDTAEVKLPDGNTRHAHINVIATSSTSLLKAVNDGDFRADLFYRLAGVTIDIPPLRRRSDIEDIAHCIVQKHAGDRRISLSEAAVSSLTSYEWPGNIRQLSNVLVRAICIMDGTSIEPAHILLDPITKRDVETSSRSEVQFSEQDTGDSLLQMADKSIIRSAMLQARGDVVVAMQNLRVSRATLYRKLKAYDLRSLTRRAQSKARSSQKSH